MRKLKTGFFKEEMKNFKLWLATVLFIASSTITFAHSNSSDWNGKYFYNGGYGHTYGGSPIVLEYTILINQDTCEIKINGFQTNEDIICIKKYTNNSITLLFKSYASGEVVNAYGIEYYHPKQPLLKLEKVNKNKIMIIKTYWLKLLTPNEKPPKPSIYFKRIHD